MKVHAATLEDAPGTPASDFVAIHPGVIKEIQAQLTRDAAAGARELPPSQMPQIPS